MDGLSRRSSRPGSIRSPARSQRIFERVRANRRSASSSPRARRSRSSAPPSAFADQGSAPPILVGREDRVARGDGDCAGIDRRRERHRDPQCAPLAAQRRLCRLPLRAPAAQGLPVPRLPAPGQPGPQPSSPPAWWRSAMPTPWSPASRATISIALEDVRRVHRPASPATASIGRVDRARARAHRAASPIPRSHEMPTAEELADIAIEAAGVARRLGYEPRVALLVLLDLRPSARASAPSGSARRSRILDQRAGRFRI